MAKVLDSQLLTQLTQPAGVESHLSVCGRLLGLCLVGAHVPCCCLLNLKTTPTTTLLSLVLLQQNCSCSDRVFLTVIFLLLWVGGIW